MIAPRYLITTQSYQHEKQSEEEIPTQFGYLVETDFSGFMRTLRIPTPTDSSFDERIKPGLRGISAWGGQLYVASWNTISVIDYNSFEIVGTFTHPLMADLHGIHVDQRGIVATSSLIDSVLFFDADRRLERVRAFSDTTFYPQKLRLELDTTQDYRYRGKTFSGFKEYHANHVTPLDDQSYLVTGRGRRKRGGYIARVDRATGRYRTWAKGLLGPHDGLFVEPGLFAVTETDSSTVALIRDRGVLGRKIIRRLELPTGAKRFWTRGLAMGPQQHLLVGQSVWSGDEGQAYVVEITCEGETVARHPLDLSDYAECRIFQIIPSPGNGRNPAA
jgi:hypothetical protein